MNNIIDIQNEINKSTKLANLLFEHSQVDNQEPPAEYYSIMVRIENLQSQLEILMEQNNE